MEAVDIVPTLLELAGIQIPPFLQGESLAPLLAGDAHRYKASALTEGSGWKSLRSENYRYLAHADGRESLWDLREDPSAYHDVASSADYQTVLAECRQQLLTRLLAMERPLPRAWTY